MTMQTIQLNAKLTVLASVVILGLLYLVYTSFHEHPPSGLPNREELAKENGAADMEVHIPDDIMALAATLKPVEKKVAVKINGKDETIFYRELKAANNTKERISTVLLLHGMSFTSSNWEDIGTMQFLSALGFWVVAIDLPGYGNSKSVKLGETNGGTFLGDFLDACKLGRPLIVSPSMSGSYALPFILSKKQKECTHHLSGYIPIAPVATEKFTPEDYKQCSVSVMIVMGSKDRNLGEKSKEHLQHFPNAIVREIQDAGHACYMDKPEEWHKLLYDFVNKAKALTFLKKP